MKIPKLAAIMAAICLLCLKSVFGFYINEVYANPIGSDNNKEFIEIYGRIDDFENLYLLDNSQNDSLTVLKNFTNVSNFTLIVEEGFDFTDLNCTILSAGASIGDNLNNNNDQIILQHFGKLVDNFSYNYTKEGKSFERVYGDGNVTFFQESENTEGSPCMKNSEMHMNNSFEGETTLNLTNNSETFLDDEFEFETELDFCLESIEVSPKIDYEGVQRSITFKTSSGIENKTVGYNIKDFEGEVYREYLGKSTATKKFTPKKINSDKLYFISAWVNGNNCQNNTREIEAISVGLKNLELSDEEGLLKIKKFENIESGFLLNIEFQRFNTTKRVINAYAENGDGIKSYKSKIYVNDDHRHLIEIPVVLKDCLSLDKYELVVEGINLVDKVKNVKFECPTRETLETSKKIEIKEVKEFDSILYELLNYEIYDKNITSKLSIQNNEEENSFYMHSYIYNHSKSYSGDREENSMSFLMKPFEKKEISLENELNGKQGQYKFKIRIFENNKKTPYEITEEISFTFEDEQSDNSGLNLENNLVNIRKNNEKIIYPNYSKEELKEEKNAVEISEEDSESSILTKAKTYIFPLILAFIISIPALYNELKRNKGKSRKRVAAHQRNVRTTWVPERARRENNKIIHGEHQAEQRNNSDQRALWRA